MKMTVTSNSGVMCDANDFTPMVRYSVDVDFDLMTEQRSVTDDDFTLELGRTLLACIKEYNGHHP